MKSINYIKINAKIIPIYLCYVLLAPIIASILYDISLIEFIGIVAIFIQQSSILFHGAQLIKVDDASHYRPLEIYYRGFKKYFWLESLNVFLWGLLPVSIIYAFLIINVKVIYIISVQIYMLCFSLIVILTSIQKEKVALRNYINTFFTVFGFILIYYQKYLELTFFSLICILLIQIIIKKKQVS